MEIHTLLFTLYAAVQHEEVISKISFIEKFSMLLFLFIRLFNMSILFTNRVIMGLAAQIILAFVESNALFSLVNRHFHCLPSRVWALFIRYEALFLLILFPTGHSIYSIE